MSITLPPPIPTTTWKSQYTRSQEPMEGHGSGTLTLTPDRFAKVAWTKTHVRLMQPRRSPAVKAYQRVHIFRLRPRSPTLRGCDALSGPTPYSRRHTFLLAPERVASRTSTDLKAMLSELEQRTFEALGPFSCSTANHQRSSPQNLWQGPLHLSKKHQAPPVSTRLEKERSLDPV